MQKAIKNPLVWVIGGFILLPLNARLQVFARNRNLAQHHTSALTSSHNLLTILLLVLAIAGIVGGIVLGLKRLIGKRKKA